MGMQMPNVQGKQGGKGHARVNTSCKEKEDPREDYDAPKRHSESTPITEDIRNALIRGTPASLHDGSLYVTSNRGSHRFKSLMHLS